MTLPHRVLRVAPILLAALAGCSARYQTGPDGLPVGQPDVTYFGPGAGIGGVPLEGPSPTAPRPGNLAAPPTPGTNP